MLQGWLSRQWFRAYERARSTLAVYSGEGEYGEYDSSIKMEGSWLVLACHIRAKLARDFWGALAPKS